MEVSRAIADLEEVRTRLAAGQRFRGLSGGAAFASGIAAIVSGAIQAASIPSPVSAADGTRYITIWIACLACSLAVNYGAIVLWLGRHWSVRSRVELKTVGMTPGTWCLCYALGLIASRAMAPPGIGWVAALFAASGTALLFAPGINALAWWVMPATFGIGQIVIGILVSRDAALETAR